MNGFQPIEIKTKHLIHWSEVGQLLVLERYFFLNQTDCKYSYL